MNEWQYENYEGMDKEKFSEIISTVTKAGERAGIASFNSYEDPSVDEALKNIDTLRSCGLSNEWGDFDLGLSKEQLDYLEDLFGYASDELKSFYSELWEHAVTCANSTECALIIESYERVIAENKR